ncbi:riboflavin synthase alpha chain [Arboricoccus pini]|uniref:Riboflavin synthase n=1 Tax=Arboricoccus pini TaxID=1963835 RepID=A0A212R341_9PROT|nr:riboflavin synthase [Arboricoccus pini]SNB66346.1 riboflavin synthase alpha chain [Arboricoccus pini]
MFTGIVTHRGIVRRVAGEESTRRLEVEPGFALDKLDIGASVSHSGVCLTVTSKDRSNYWVDVSPETLARSTIGSWQPGTSVNIERSLKIGDDLGGHLVFGHVDGIASIRKVESLADGNWSFVFELPPDLAPLVAVKGSIAVDGISLTVAAVDADSFSVSVIPHTYKETTLHDRQVGDAVNLEADMLARYVARQLGRAA